MRHSIFVIAILIVVSSIICGHASSNEADSVYCQQTMLRRDIQPAENNVKLIGGTKKQLWQSEVCQFQRNISEEGIPFVTLRQASAESAQLKTTDKLVMQETTPVNSKAAVTVDELKKQIGQAAQQGTLWSDIQLAENNVKPIGGPRKQSLQFEVCQFQQNISEEGIPFVTLRQASAESTQVKTSEQLGITQKTPLNSKAAETVDELKRQMEQATKQAKALQELVSKIVAQTELLKMQGRQTELKLNDMRKMTKMWQEKNIPVNSEARVLENNLSSEIAIYQNTLKEIDRLNQFLTSMFNEVSRTGPTR